MSDVADVLAHGISASATQLTHIQLDAPDDLVQQLAVANHMVSHWKRLAEDRANRLVEQQEAYAQLELDHVL